MLKYLEQLSPEEAKTVLRLLSQENRELAGRIEEQAKAQISDVDVCQKHYCIAGRNEEEAMEAGSRQDSLNTG